VTARVPPSCLAAAVAVAVLGVLAGRAHGEASPTDEARGRYDRGTRLYLVGEYRRAIDEFKEGYLANADPAFLYNLARCHQRLDERDQAVTFYRRFLAADPGTPRRAEVEREIRVLAGKQPAAALLAPAPPPKPPLYKRAAFWDVVAAGVIAAVIALSLGLKH